MTLDGLAQEARKQLQKPGATVPGLYDWLMGHPSGFGGQVYTFLSRSGPNIPVTPAPTGSQRAARPIEVPRGNSASQRAARHTGTGNGGADSGEVSTPPLAD